MKRLILTLLFALLCAVNASATTVTISAYSLQNLPFNPSNIGSDRPITVTATNGSVTVTSLQQFPSNIVGIGGFQVLIDGTQYVVSSVVSTSSLTLTTAYGGTSGSQTMTLYKYVLMRAYATAGFQDNVTGQNIQPGTPGSGFFYKQIAVSVINSGSGNVAYIPEFTIPSTTDALMNNQARYVFGFYRPDNSLLSYYTCAGVQQLFIRPDTPTTWTAICNYNVPNGIVPPNTTVYTEAQIDARFPSCSADQIAYFAADGNKMSCLSLGTNLSITSGVLNAGGGSGGGVSSVFVSLNYTTLNTDYLVAMDASGATRTVTLIAAASVPNQIQIVCKNDTSANTVIISDGSSTLGTIYGATACMQLSSNGSAWKVLTY